MSGKKTPISGEDYIEPQCLLNMDGACRQQSVPQLRIRDKLDEYMCRRDHAGAKRHLLYWLEEARQVGDLRGQLMVWGELIGFYRKTGDRDGALSACGEALRLLEALGFTDNLSAGTTLINAATAYCAFAMEEEAYPLFLRAKEIYEALPEVSPELLGGLYNNMGLACGALARYEEARGLFQRALEIMETVPEGTLEQAITCLNMADTLNAELGAEGDGQIAELLDKAKRLLLAPEVERDAYFAFVCEKCAPGFRDYGDEDTAAELERLAERYYAGT